MHRFPLAIIPAGGKGTRMGPGPHKCLRLVNGEPIIRHVVRFWMGHSDSQVVVAPREMAREMSMAMPSAIVRADEGRGICQAVLTGLRSAPPQFIVALGDCLFDGEFGPMPEGPFTGVAVQHQPESEWGRSYAVGEHQNLIEKPSLGLGAYFFTWSHLWALEQYQGITAAMGALEARTAVHRIEFTGFYRNLTYPEDLQKPWPG